MKAYKGFDKNMKCRNFQFEECKTYEEPKAILCQKGFHACEAPLDVLRYYPINRDNIYREVECEKVSGEKENDSKLVCQKITIGAQIGLPGLIKAHFEYTRQKAENKQKGGYGSNLAGGDRSNLAGGDGSNLASGYGSNLAGGDGSNLAGGDRSNLAGGDRSNLAGGDGSNLAGGYGSNLAGGDGSNLAGGDGSNLAGGDRSNLAGGYGSTLAGGDRSNLAGGDGSNLAGGDRSNLAGGDGSNLAGGESALIMARNPHKVKAGLHSVIVLTNWEWCGNGYIPVSVKAEIVDGERIKANTWYTLRNGEWREVEDDDTGS